MTILTKDRDNADLNIAAENRAGVEYPLNHLLSAAGAKIDPATDGALATLNATAGGLLTNTQLRATPVPVSGTFWQATQPVSFTWAGLTDAQLRATAVPVSGTFWQATQPVSGPLTDTQLRATPVVTEESTTGTHYQPGFDVASGIGAGGPLRTDPDGNLVARAQVLTDELGYRANFANTSLAVDIGTATFTNGSRIVTGAGLISADMRSDDYCKLNADAESAWMQIETLDSDTQLTLIAPYTGTGGTGASSRAILKPVTGAGGAISVASGVCTMTSGTTANAITEVERDVDWLPLVKQAGVAVSQRIVNQGVYVGFYDELSPAAPKYFAWFLLDGTTNTTVKCQSARNPTQAPSAAEIEETMVTLPNGATTAASRRYRPEVLGDRVNFLIDGVLVATHYRSMPGPGDLLTSTVRVLNGAVAPASSTTVTVDFDTVKNHNKLEVGLLSDAEQVVAAQPPAQMFTYSAGAVIIPINTDLIVIDCSQLRHLSVHLAAIGTTGVVTPAWSNDGTNWLTATMLNEAGASSTTIAAPGAALRTTPVRARYFRLRMTTATTAAGSTSIIVAALQQDIAPIVTTQPVSGSVTVSGSLTSAGTTTATPVTPTASILNSAATTNGTVVKGTAGTLYSMVVSNTNAAARFVKLYNSATVTVGTTAVALTVTIPANGTVLLEFGAVGMRFGTGICISTTTGAADADTGAVAAGEIKVLTSFI